MPTWPKDELLQHGAELTMAERVRRYQHNIRTIRDCQEFRVRAAC